MVRATDFDSVYERSIRSAPSKIQCRSTVMQKLIDCPLCNGGQLRIDTANGYRIIIDGRLSKLPLKKRCPVCTRNVKYAVVRDEDYDKMLAWVQEK